MSEWDQIESALFLRWCQGDTEAVNLIERLGYLSQLVDDLADGDIAAPDISKNVSLAMVVAMAEIPANPFFAKHEAALRPLIVAAWLGWDHSNDLAKSTGQDLLFAFVRREAVDAVIVQIAFLIGGAEHAQIVTREAHNFYHVQDAENFADWMEEQGGIACQ